MKYFKKLDGVIKIDNDVDFYIIGNTPSWNTGIKSLYPNKTFLHYLTGIDMVSVYSKLLDFRNENVGPWYAFEKLRYSLVENSIIAEGKESNFSEVYRSTRKIFDVSSEEGICLIKEQTKRAIAQKYDGFMFDNFKTELSRPFSWSFKKPFTNVGRWGQISSALLMARQGLSTSLVNYSDPWYCFDNGAWMSDAYGAATLNAKRLVEAGVTHAMFEYYDKKGDFEVSVACQFIKDFVLAGGQMLFYMQDANSVHAKQLIETSKDSYYLYKP